MTDLSELKMKLAMSSRMLFNAGLVDYSGHISARIPGSDHLLILPHPISRATVKPEDMVVSDFEGKLVEGKYNAPSEVFMHARAYKSRDDIQSVAHLHNHMVATLTMVDKPFFPASSNPGAFFGPGPLPVYKDPALIHTIEQGDAVAHALGKPWQGRCGFASWTRLNGRGAIRRVGVCRLCRLGRGSIEILQSCFFATGARL